MNEEKKEDLRPMEMAGLLAKGVIRIDWSAPPPRDKRKYLEIFSPKVGKEIEGICLHERPIALNMHFLWDCSFPHIEPRELCVGCGPDSALRWKCYIGILVGTQGKQGIAEITEQAALCCPALLNPAFDLRDYRLTLRRKGVRANSPVTALVQELPDRLKVRYPTFDLVEQLSFIWCEGLARKQPRLYKQMLENQLKQKEGE